MVKGLSISSAHPLDNLSLHSLSGSFQGTEVLSSSQRAQIYQSFFFMASAVCVLFKKFLLA